MTAARVLFDLAGGIAVFFAATMVLFRNPIKGLLSVVLSFFALAVEFVILSAPFLAAIQVIVYAGAILVLFLFVTMLLHPDEEEAPGARRPIQALLSLAGITFLALALFAAIRRSGAPAGAAASAPPGDNLAAMSRSLFSGYVLPFEAISVLLLAALTAAFVLSKRERK